MRESWGFFYLFSILFSGYKQELDSYENICYKLEVLKATY